MATCSREFIMFGSLTVFTQSCVYSWHRIEHTLTLKKIYTGFSGQIVVIMNDCLGSSKTTLSFSELLTQYSAYCYTQQLCFITPKRCKANSAKGKGTRTEVQRKPGTICNGPVSGKSQQDGPNLSSIKELTAID